MSLKRVMLVFALVLVLAAAAAWFFLRPAPGGGAATELTRRGVLTVAVRHDAPPFSRRSPEGEMTGFEADLARDLAGRLGTEVAFRPVRDDARLAGLESGEVDVVLAAVTRLSAEDSRVRLVEPAYYAGGANVLVRTDARLDGWEDLEGWPVCAVQGAEYNERVAEAFGARVIVFRDEAEALEAFDTGDCRALLSDEDRLISLLVQPDFASYELPLSHIEGRHWFLTVRPDRPKLRSFLKQAVEDWHESGTVVELERKWNMRPSEFAARQHQGSGETQAEPAGGP